MTCALKAVNIGKSVKRALMEDSVPRTTLHERHSGRVVHGSNTDPQQYFNKAEEEELRDFIITGRGGLWKDTKSN